MRKRTQVLLAGAVLAAAGVAFGVHRYRQASPAGPAAELLSYAPADSSVVAYADVAALRGSPLLVKLAALAPAAAPDRDYAEFLQATNFQYERDLDRVGVAQRSRGNAQETYVVAEGRFDRKKIAAYALRSGRVERQNGADVYIVPTNGPAKNLSFTFLDERHIALASGPNLAPLLAPHRATNLPRALQERIARLAGSPVFAVGRMSASLNNEAKQLPLGGLRSDQLDALVAGLRWVSFAARPEGDHLRIVLEGECDTEENARQLAGAVKTLAFVGQMALSDPKTRKRMDPESVAALEELLKSAEVSRENLGETQGVRLILDLSPKLLDAAKPAERAADEKQRNNDVTR